jgi:flagellar motor protein MotB
MAAVRRSLFVVGAIVAFQDQRNAHTSTGWLEMGLFGHRPGIALSLVLTLALVTAARPAIAQAPVDTVATLRGGVGLHGLLGGFAGWLDTGGVSRDLVGARAGIGLGEVLQLGGFYWRGVDRSAREFESDQAFGADARIVLNTGYGVAPFLTAGLARLTLADADPETAVIGGGGLLLPIGPVLLSVAAHDYIRGVTGLGAGDFDDATHNWQFTAGITFGLGRTRSREPIVVERPPLVALDEGDPGLVVEGGVAARAAPTEAEPGPGEAAALRNYQSDRSIEVPIPLEGSITLRYGPERPVVAEATGPRPGVAAERDPRPADPVRDLAADPVLQVWLRQAVAAEVATQLAGRGPFQVPPAPGQAPVAGVGERAIEAIVENALAGLALRLEAAETQRMNALRRDLRTAFEDQLEIVLDEIARLERRLPADGTVARGAPPPGPPLAVRPAPAAPVAPPAERVPARPGDAPPDPAPPVAVPARPDPGPPDPVAREGAVRRDLVALAAHRPGLLTMTETPRGPAIVLADAAFDRASGLPAEPARAILAELAMLAQRHGGPVFVQGHTDAAQGELDSQRASEVRAETVRSILVQAGLEAGRVFALGFGHGRPVADNASPAGRQQNRRVEIVMGTGWSGQGPTAIRREGL